MVKISAEFAKLSPSKTEYPFFWTTLYVQQLLRLKFHHSKNSLAPRIVSVEEFFSHFILDLLFVHIQGGPKLAHFVRLITSLNIYQFSNIFHCQNQNKICNRPI